MYGIPHIRICNCQNFSHISHLNRDHTNSGIEKRFQSEMSARGPTIPDVLIPGFKIYEGDNYHVQVQQVSRSRSKGSSEPVQDGSRKRLWCTFPILKTVCFSHFVRAHRSTGQEAPASAPRKACR